MAQLSASRVSRSVVVEPNLSSQLEGREGQQLNEQVSGVAKSIRKVETIKRLMRPYEQQHENQHKQLLAYLETLRIEAQSAGEIEFTVSLINLAEQVWSHLKNHFRTQGKCLEVPDACPGSNDNFMYVWSTAEHYLECEIFGDGTVEFFYRNRSTGDNWGEDTTLGYGLSTTIFAKVALFTW